MVLTREDLELLKRLQAAGERGRTIPEFNTRIALQRLARGGYVVAGRVPSWSIIGSRSGAKTR